MSKPMRPAETEFDVSLRAHSLAVAEWLGLDPAKVLDLNAERHREIPRMYDYVGWAALDRSEPTRGTVGPWGFDEAPYRPALFINEVHFNYDEGRELFDAVGPVPQMFTPDERAALNAIFGEGA